MMVLDVEGHLLLISSFLVKIIFELMLTRPNRAVIELTIDCVHLQVDALQSDVLMDGDVEQIHHPHLLTSMARI